MRRDIDYQKYNRAKRKVDNIRGLYSHLAVYILVNLAISGYKIYEYIEDGASFEAALTSLDTYIVWLFWGIGVALHVFSVYGLPLILGDNWEERKIKQYMDEDPNY